MNTFEFPQPGERQNASSVLVSHDDLCMMVLAVARDAAEFADFDPDGAAVLLTIYRRYAQHLTPHIQSLIAERMRVVEAAVSAATAATVTGWVFVPAACDYCGRAPGDLCPDGCPGDLFG